MRRDLAIGWGTPSAPPSEPHKVRGKGVAMLHKAPAMPTSAYNAGWVSERLGNLPQAETHYRKAMELDGDYNSAIDALADKLDRQIKRHKEKRHNHHRTNGGAKRS